MLVLLASQLLVIANIRGVADREGYLLNTSKYFHVNTYEDDGVIGLRAALGYSRLHEGRFSYLIGVGGPVVHAAKPVMAALSWLGLITRFEDPSLYELYPSELDKAYKAYALYQLLAYTLWLPLSAYVLLSRHASRRAGVWGAWLLALLPFAMAFEPRIKPDTPALLFGLLALHCSLNHLRDGGFRNKALAWGLLGLSASIKLTCVPFAGTFLVLDLVRSRRDKSSFVLGVLKAAAVSGVVFLAANPLILAGLADITRWLGGYYATMHSTPGGNAGQGSSLALLGGQLFSLDVFFGPLLKWAYPLILAGGGAVWAATRSPMRAWNALWLTCLLQIGYMATVSGNAFATITYYHYTSAVLGLLLTAWALDRVQQELERLPSVISRTSNAVLVAAIVLPVLATGLTVLRYVTSPTNRQVCHTWIRDTIRPGSSIGVALPTDGQPVNEFLRIDPFCYAVTQVGKDLNLLERVRPQYLVLVSQHRPGRPAPVQGYELAASFDAGEGLPRNGLGLFQDETFWVYRSLQTATPPRGAALLELSLGDAMRADPDPAFQILQYKSLRFYPISLELFRKADDTVLAFSTSAFTGSIRDASSPVAYVHHVDCLALRLWGVKYILAAKDGSFKENVLEGGYPLREVPLPGVPQDSGQGLYRFQGYAGQALFAGDSPWETRKMPWRPWRKQGLPNAGTLPGATGAKAMEVMLDIEADGPVDVLLGQGKDKHAYLAGPGRSVLHVAMETEGTEGVAYEINPATSGVKPRLLAVSSRPLLLETPVLGETSISPRYCFTSVKAPSPGRVFFAMPWHGFWKAEVDGHPVQAEPGPCGVVAVPVDAGAHDVSLMFGS